LIRRRIREALLRRSRRPEQQSYRRLGVSKRTESKLELDNDGGRLLPSMLGFVNLMRSLLLSPPDVRFGWSE
jgi:hypothetical protein